MWDRTNGPIVRSAVVLTPQATSPISSGTAGIWNNSGNIQFAAPAGNSYPIGNDILTVPFIASQAISGAVVARVSPDFACRVAAIDLQGMQVAGTSGSATFQVGIQGASASGGVVTAVAANLAVGIRTAGTAITGANAVGASGEITVTVAAALSGSFAAGQGLLVIKLGPPA